MVGLGPGQGGRTVMFLRSHRKPCNWQGAEAPGCGRPPCGASWVGSSSRERALGAGHLRVPGSQTSTHGQAHLPLECAVKKLTAGRREQSRSFLVSELKPTPECLLQTPTERV